MDNRLPFDLFVSKWVGIEISYCPGKYLILQLARFISFSVFFSLQLKIFLYYTNTAAASWE